MFAGLFFVFIGVGFIILFPKLIPTKVDPFVAKLDGYTECPNGDLMEGKPSNINSDGGYAVYNEQGWFIYSVGGWGSHSESLIYLFRKWRKIPMEC